MVAGGFALSSFPLDDIWHRLFGQDVTLWGPTHLMMIGGAVLTLLGQAALMVEGMRARPNDDHPPLITRIRQISLMGGLLIGVSLLQAEFDFGVPQFRLVFQPLLIAFAAGLCLVAARIWSGPGAALGALVMYLVMRSGLALLVGPVLGEATPLFALYAVEALAVEACALALGTGRPLRLGLASGLAIGTLGFASEWVWADLVMPIEWTGGTMPEALLMAVGGGLAGGALGALLGAALNGEMPRPPVPRLAFAASLLVLGALVANGLAVSNPERLRAAVTLQETSSAPQREAMLTARFDPADGAEDAAWLQAVAWQGGGLVTEDLEPIGGGAYRTTDPVPVAGGWKTTLRLQDGRNLLSIPVYMPADPAIPAPAVPAPASFERTFVPDIENLQRERKDGVGWLSSAAALMVLGFALAFAAFMAWGIGRVGRSIEPPGRGPGPRPAPLALPRLGRALGFTSR
jgi:hypothetical protein